MKILRIFIDSYLYLDKPKICKIILQTSINKTMKTSTFENQSLFIKDFAMTRKNTLDRKSITAILKDSMMVILTFIFVLLYAGAFAEKFDPLKANVTLLRLEPIIFILIGYYFGRLPSLQNEQCLKEEIARQTQRADAAQYAKEKAQQERETLEEKIKNARMVIKTEDQTKAVNTALGILDS